MPQAYASRSTISEAIELVNSGLLDQAEALCRDAVERNPRDVNIIALLGVILLKSRRPEEAEQCLRDAIKLAPNFAKPHEDLGRLLIEQSRAKEAVKVLQNATRLDPKSSPAFFALGQALISLGKGKEADEAFEASFELDPEKKSLALAAEHQKAGRMEEAESIYRQILRENPKHVDAYRISSAQFWIWVVCSRNRAGGRRRSSASRKSTGLSRTMSNPASSWRRLSRRRH
jgi:tetratricopeptide (TPR) repeat protein